MPCGARAWYPFSQTHAGAFSLELDTSLADSNALLLCRGQVDYTETFRLFCTTRLPNPHFTPELSARVTVIDFTVTQAGLEDQLLGKLILKARRRAVCHVLCAAASHRALCCMIGRACHHHLRQRQGQM